MSYTPIIANSLGGGRARKSADTSRLNVLTLTDDPDLVLPLDANASYTLYAHVKYTASLTGGFKMGWDLPAGVSIDWGSSGAAFNLTKTLTDTLAITVSGAGTYYMFVSGIIRTGSTPGNLALSWCNNGPNVLTPTVLNAESQIVVIKTTS